MGRRLRRRMDNDLQRGRQTPPHGVAQSRRRKPAGRGDGHHRLQGQPRRGVGRHQRHPRSSVAHPRIHRPGRRQDHTAALRRHRLHGRLRRRIQRETRPDPQPRDGQPDKLRICGSGRLRSVRIRFGGTTLQPAGTLRNLPQLPDGRQTMGQRKPDLDVLCVLPLLQPENAPRKHDRLVRRGNHVQIRIRRLQRPANHSGLVVQRLRQGHRRIGMFHQMRLAHVGSRKSARPAQKRHVAAKLPRPLQAAQNHSGRIFRPKPSDHDAEIHLLRKYGLRNAACGPVQGACQRHELRGDFLRLHRTQRDSRRIFRRMHVGRHFPKLFLRQQSPDESGQKRIQRVYQRHILQMASGKLHRTCERSRRHVRRQP